MEEEKLAKLLGGATLSLFVVVVCLVLGFVFRAKSKNSSATESFEQPIFKEDFSSTSQESPVTQAPTSTSQESLSQTSASQKTYTVEPGDTLYGIAQKFGVDWKELAATNNIADATSLRVGQKLIIP